MTHLSLFSGAQFYPIFAAIAEAAEDGKNEKRN